MQEKIILYREKGFDFSPIYVEINKEKFPINRGDRKEICLPVGKHIITASGWFGTKGYKEIEVKEGESKAILLTNTISPQISIIGISIFIPIFILHYMELLPALVFPIVVFSVTLAIFLFTTLGRKKYYKFTENF